MAHYINNKITQTKFIRPEKLCSSPLYTRIYSLKNRLNIFWILGKQCGEKICFCMGIFKASALWADDFYKSVCPYACLSVCLSVCLFTFEVPFNVFLPPLPKVRCPKILKIWNPWGKVME